MTNIKDLKIGQTIWFFDKYGDLQSGTILGLKPNNFPTNYHREIGMSFDDVSLTHPRYPNDPNITMSICAKQTMIYTSKPNQEEYVDDISKIRAKKGIDKSKYILVNI